jgi:hypothetical protein
VYQREATGSNLSASAELRFFNAPERRRLSAEQVVDSLYAASGQQMNTEEITFDPTGRRPEGARISLGKPSRAWMFANLTNDRDRPSLSLPYSQCVVDVLEASAPGAPLDPNAALWTAYWAATALAQNPDPQPLAMDDDYVAYDVPEPRAILDEWTLDHEFGLLSYNASSRQSVAPWSWHLFERSYPEDGWRQTENPPAWWDRSGRRDLPHLYAERPFPCPLGSYCYAGVATNDTHQPLNFSTPQRCFDGFFCPRGSKTPEGQGPCPTGFYCPTQTDAIPCPSAHYCPDVGNTRPLPCYPGTYNPLDYQSNCTLCPPGFICPEWSMLYPVICPAGFVCTDPGLSQPVVQCTPGYYCPAGTLTLDISDTEVDDPLSPPYGAEFLFGVDPSLQSPFAKLDQDGNILPPREGAGLGAFLSRVEKRTGKGGATSVEDYLDILHEYK